jgi:hypothetical protein
MVIKPTGMRPKMTKAAKAQPPKAEEVKVTKANGKQQFAKLITKPTKKS